MEYNKRKDYYNIKMRTLHQKLHLQHHRHTGKLLHHSHTSYRSVFGVLVLAAACMGGLAYMQHAAATELGTISASVHVPVPHAPATISEPADGAVITGGGTVIVGSCPLVAPQPVIVVDIDGTDVGSAACSASSKFSFSADLPAGTHTIVATPYTIDNDHGPASDPVHVTSQAVTAATPSGALTPSTLFTTLDSTKTATWTGTLTGSQASYRLLLEWGDGNYDSYTVRPGPQHLAHRYAHFASYTITIGVQDDTGNYAYQQLAAAVRDPTQLAALGTADDSGQRVSRTNTIIGLYGLFVTVVCLVAVARLHAAPFAYAPLRIGHHA
jgi:hypothetical protein